LHSASVKTSFVSFFLKKQPVSVVFLDKYYSRPQDFALRQGGKGEQRRSILPYVTELNESSQRRIRVKDKGHETLRRVRLSASTHTVCMFIDAPRFT